MDYIYIINVLGLQFIGDAPWHVPTGWDFGWVFMIIGIFFVWDDAHIVPIFDGIL